MSILKSTNTGRCSIKIDVPYLESNGWYFKYFPTGGRDKYHIYKDDTHCLTLIDSDLYIEETTLITFQEETENFIYNIIITHLDHLDDIEKFWKDREIDFEKAEKEFLEKYPNAKQPNIFNKSADELKYELSKLIDKNILKKINCLKDNQK